MREEGIDAAYKPFESCCCWLQSCERRWRWSSRWAAAAAAAPLTRAAPRAAATTAAATASTTPPDRSARLPPTATPWPTEEPTGSRATTSSWTHSVSYWCYIIISPYSLPPPLLQLFIRHVLCCLNTLLYHNRPLLYFLLFVGNDLQLSESGSDSDDDWTLCWSVSALSTLLLLLSAWFTPSFAVIADSSCISRFDCIFILVYP